MIEDALSDPLSVQGRYNEMEEKIDKCNCIKYAAYRTAAKLRIVQKMLGFDYINVSLVKNIIEHRRILLTDSNILLSKEEAEDLLYDIFFAARKISNQNYNVEEAVKMATTFLFKVYESDTPSINILNFKVGLVSLCSSPLQHKYSYWFAQLADHNLCLSRRRLQSLLEAMLRIPHYLSEWNTFSPSLIESTIESCFTRDNSFLGINESEFICWVVREPQLLVWLSTLYRMQSSEKVVHNIQCAVCCVPIIGLRYRCLRCLGYDLCQTCFFTAQKSKRHKPNHMIREYCSKTSSCETTVAFLKGIIRRLCGSPNKLQYLPARAKPNPGEIEKDEDPLITSASERSSGFSETNTSYGKPKTQLQKIISRIENEKSLFINALENGSAENVIRRHSQFLHDHLEQLRALMSEMEQEEPLCFRSTPCRGEVNPDFELSPIIVNSEHCSNSHWEIPSPSGFSAWINQNSSENSTYTQQLQKDLDNIMDKLNGLLETTFTEADN